MYGVHHNSLFLKATGYSHPAVKIFLPAGSRKPVVVPYTEYYPPDTGAAALWLHNRDPKRWQRRTAPPDDPPPAHAAEAEQKRRAAFATMMALIEERAREGKPPIFAHPQPKPLTTSMPLSRPRVVQSNPPAPQRW